MDWSAAVGVKYIGIRVRAENQSSWRYFVVIVNVRPISSEAGIIELKIGGEVVIATSLGAAAASPGAWPSSPGAASALGLDVLNFYPDDNRLDRVSLEITLSGLGATWQAGEMVVSSSTTLEAPALSNPFIQSTSWKGSSSTISKYIGIEVKAENNFIARYVVKVGFKALRAVTAVGYVESLTLSNPVTDETSKGVKITFDSGYDVLPPGLSFELTGTDATLNMGYAEKQDSDGEIWNVPFTTRKYQIYGGADIWIKPSAAGFGVEMDPRQVTGIVGPRKIFLYDEDKEPYLSGGGTTGVIGNSGGTLEVTLNGSGAADAVYNWYWSTELVDPSTLRDLKVIGTETGLSKAGVSGNGQDSKILVLGPSAGQFRPTLTPTPAAGTIARVYFLCVIENNKGGSSGEVYDIPYIITTTPISVGFQF